MSASTRSSSRTLAGAVRRLQERGLVTTESLDSEKSHENIEQQSNHASQFRREVAEDIIRRIESGETPWQKPWDPAVGNNGLPRNGITGRPYNGFNSFILDMKAPDADPRWVTYKQAEEKGWQVKPGSKGTRIEFWQRVERDVSDAENPEAAPERKSFLIAKTYTVFHASQIDGMPPFEPKPLPPEKERFEKAEELARSVGAPVLDSKDGRAFFSPSLDEIRMPPRAAFSEPGAYESVLLHEAAHATGHESRLNRSIMNKFGTQDYAREELRAEMTSAILAREIGVPHDPDRHAAYARGWAEAIKRDPNELFRAAADAQKIAGWIVDRAVERGVEIDTTLTARSQPQPALTPDRAASSPAPAKTLGEAVHRWSGRVTEISEDRTSATMRAAGRDTVIKMPVGQTLPENLVTGGYGKLVAGRDGEPARFTKAAERTQERGTEREISR